MITNFKLFENENQTYKVGDIVYAIDIAGSGEPSLKYDTKYRIVKIYDPIDYQKKEITIPVNNDKGYFCDVRFSNNYGSIILKEYMLSRFISEEEYKLRKDVNKYNL